jgi:multimeric flavodoxin WrbA
MNVIGINGSPRKRWNTATLVAKALEGAASLGATTELFHLYDLDFKGCTPTSSTRPIIVVMLLSLLNAISFSCTD